MADTGVKTGPLAGVKVIELGGIGPGPHAAMMLSDLGADVIRVRRPGGLAIPAEDSDLFHRGKRLVNLDVKKDPEALLALVDKADVLLDPFRPGVCERIGIGPQECAKRNPRLIFARMTGWGQDGPMADRAGHDINYLSLTGALGSMGYKDRPPMPPMNLVADFGGGSMLLVQGILAALYEREKSGKGQVIDGAMVDGVSQLAQMQWTMYNNGLLFDERESALLDGGSPFYGTYETSDGKYMAVGSIEPQFFAILVQGLGLDPESVPFQLDKPRYPEMRKMFDDAFKTKTRDEWTEIFIGTDACVSPVLTWAEAKQNAHLRDRGTIIDVNGATQAAPAPRFSRTPSGPIAAPPKDTTELADIGW
ncbi:carnitine dehydratase [Mycobacteroides saopaulense]|uniref:Alpha-methylacyl-CoA racemase n=1 Tax=Mycobacteroides saopaulense TaxID=1578165 RepID=A0A1X0INF0_9MYCO|nr:CaiB/BaiF CoA-transferase family protein [Mycobacteroides saopaulense]ORB49840.1 carnitine dehydratase [Mycobacteroides saopaulense]